MISGINWGRRVRYQGDNYSYQDWNLYVYCRNNPVKMIDPNGLYGIDVHFYLTYALAYYVGFSKEDSLSIATYNQFVDDNPATSSTYIKIY